jgi:hypothetical protein
VAINASIRLPLIHFVFCDKARPLGVEGYLKSGPDRAFAKNLPQPHFATSTALDLPGGRRYTDATLRGVTASSLRE